MGIWAKDENREIMRGRMDESVVRRDVRGVRRYRDTEIGIRE
jgi:hypothetical protein